MSPSPRQQLGPTVKVSSLLDFVIALLLIMFPTLLFDLLLIVFSTLLLDLLLIVFSTQLLALPLHLQEGDEVAVELLLPEVVAPEVLEVAEVHLTHEGGQGAIG